MTTKLAVYQEALRLIGEHDIATITDDVECRYVFDGEYDNAILYCLAQGWWRFAFFTAAVAPAGSSTVPGYTQAFAKPAGWLRTHSVGIINSTTRFVPIDFNEQGGSVYVKYTTGVVLKYLKASATEIDPANWPEVFAKVVAAYLAMACCERIGQSRATKADISKVYAERLGIARALESHTPPLTLPDHAVERCARGLLEQGYWRFSILTVAPTGGYTPAAGYSSAFLLPADFMRVYDILVESSGKLRAIDWHIEGTLISAKAAAIRLQYVSSAYVTPSTWTEAFIDAVESALALAAARATGEAGSDKIEAAKAQLDTALDQALAKDGLPRPARLPEHAVETSARELLEQGYWRHSLKTVAPATTTSPPLGYSQAFTLPADFLRIYDVTVESSGKLRPIDWIVEGTKLSAKAAAVRLRYVSTDFLAPATWTEGFAQAIDGMLEVKANPGKTAGNEAGLDKIVDGALAKDGLPRPRRLPEHAVERSARGLLEQGFWAFSIKSATPAGTTGPAVGYASAYTLPADHLRTYDVCVLANARLYQIDRKEEGGKLSTQFAANVRLRYVSSDFLVPSTWPEAFAHAVDVMLSIEALRAADAAIDIKAASAQLAKMLDAELGKERLPRPLLLPPGAVDRIVRSQLESGLWKFAIKTVSISKNIATASPGYAYAFDKPADWQRTVRVFRLMGSGLTSCEYDIDFRDELSDLHANYNPIHLRYLISGATNPSVGWTELFAAAFDAGLRYESALAEGLGEAEVQARQNSWKHMLGEAKVKDGLNERPKVYNEGRFNLARRGYSGGRRDPQWPFGG
jgi:hypothetical protein